MKVAILTGGRSGEHDVSLETGRAVSGAVAELGHVAFQLVLGRSGGARWPGGEGRVGAALAALEAWGPDVAFIAMHGRDGEDGRVQGALEVLGVPYQGSGVAGSALAMDKPRSKGIYRAAGIPVARDRVLGRAALEPGFDWEAVAGDLGLPLVLKTSHSGSSVGVEIVDECASLRDRGRALLAEDPSLLVEEHVAGVELTCPVLEGPGGAARALPLLEIRPHAARFFDYPTKYDPDAVDELCPAPIDEALAEEVRALGLRCHAALGCRDYSRTDLMVGADGRPRVLETNTLPGLTPASLLPKSAAADGMTFPGLIDHLLRLAALRA